MAALLPDLPQAEAAIIEMTNAFRAENRLGNVALNQALKAAAQSFAEHLARTGTFAHTADGRQPSERAYAAGYKFCMVAENLALNQSSRGFDATELAERMVEGWKNSPPHRASMLQPHLTEIGVGIARTDDKDPKFLTVQLFGRPERFKYEVRIENHSQGTVAYTFGEQRSHVPEQSLITHKACVPHEITFDVGKVTSKFDAVDGVVFSITRGADNALRVERRTPPGAPINRDPVRKAAAPAGTSTNAALPKAIKAAP